jgi:hypothetical protein
MDTVGAVVSGSGADVLKVSVGATVELPAASTALAANA